MSTVTVEEGRLREGRREQDWETRNRMSPELIRQAAVLRPRPIPLVKSHLTARQRIRNNHLVAADGVPTVIVAASDSPAWMKRCADFICTGHQDDRVIQAAIDLLPDC